MTELEWKEVEPEQEDWKKQIDVVAYYGSIAIGSIVYCGEEIGWQVRAWIFCRQNLWKMRKKK